MGALLPQLTPKDRLMGGLERAIRPLQAISSVETLVGRPLFLLTAWLSKHCMLYRL